jgi:hypothetical protein
MGDDDRRSRARFPGRTPATVHARAATKGARVSTSSPDAGAAAFVGGAPAMFLAFDSLVPGRAGYLDAMHEVVGERTRQIVQARYKSRFVEPVDGDLDHNALVPHANALAVARARLDAYRVVLGIPDEGALASALERGVRKWRTGPLPSDIEPAKTVLELQCRAIERTRDLLAEFGTRSRAPQVTRSVADLIAWRERAAYGRQAPVSVALADAALNRAAERYTAAVGQLCETIAQRHQEYENLGESLDKAVGGEGEIYATVFVLVAQVREGFSISDAIRACAATSAYEGNIHDWRELYEPVDTAAGELLAGGF